ncbi:hypothetical protein GCM10027065_01840 [Rhodanobacter koreensis]
MPGRNPIPGSPEVDVLAFQERDDEIVFRAEVSIQARLRHACLLNHQIDTNGADALPVKEGRRAFQNPFAYVPRFGTGGFSASNRQGRSHCGYQANFGVDMVQTVL